MRRFLVKSILILIISGLSFTTGSFIGNAFRRERDLDVARKGCLEAKKYRDTHIPSTDLELQVYNLNQEFVEKCEEGGM